MGFEIRAEDLERDPALRDRVSHRTSVGLAAIHIAARDDFNLFYRYVFQQKQHPWHRELQRLFSAHSMLCVDAPVEHGKTTQTVARVCWEIGRNPAVMIGYFSNSSILPERAVRRVRQTIEQNERYRAVFPGVEIVQALTNQLWVKRQGGGMHPTLIGLGVGGSIIGSRLTHIILDDIQDFDNTWTDHERRKLWELLQSTVLNRRLKNGKLWDIGTPWHVSDARHQLRRMHGVHTARFDATRGTHYERDGSIVPLAGGDLDGLWTEVYTDPETGDEYGWPRERLEQKRRQMPALEFDRQFRCMASAGSLRIFDPEAVAKCVRAGRGLVLPARARPDDPVLSAVDLAVSRESYADETVIFTGTVRQSPAGARFVPLDLRAGRWEITRIFEEFAAVLDFYPNHLGFTVENNQAQDYLVQMLRNDKWLDGIGFTQQQRQRLRVRPHTTTAGNKWNPIIGVRAMAGDFEQGRWIIPSDVHGVPLPEVQPLVDGLLGFDPSSHTSDYVMAAWLWMDTARRSAVGSSDDLWSRVGVA